MDQQDPVRRRTAFVTGASSGIGAAIASALAMDGYDLAVSATSVDRIADVTASLQDTGAHVVPVALNLREPASVEDAFDTVVDALGELDLLVNSAGVMLVKPALDVTAEDWDAVIQTNVTGTFFLTQEMGRHLIDGARAGSIVSLASTHGVVGFAGRSVYGISKAAIIQMTRMLAIEWADRGIRVNAIAPGTVETASRAASMADQSARERMLARIPLRRFITVEEVAAAVLYLASPEAASITGQTIIVDGGLTAY